MKRVGKSKVEAKGKGQEERKGKGKVDWKKKSTKKSQSKSTSKNEFEDNQEKKFSDKRKSSATKKRTEPKTKTGNKKLLLKDEVRLNRYLANAGISSRREADKYIESGIVTINGKVVTELGTKVKYGDDVRFNDAPLAPEKKTYILLNKPKDYVTTLEDPHAKRTVIDLIRNGCQERVYPVGRLDKATTGLLLLTNDGDLAEFLAHPRNNKKKIYQATLDKPANTDDLQKLYDGITLEDGTIKADEITFVDPSDKRDIGIEIHSGKNRIVRRMFEHIGYKVRKLDRVYFAGLTKKNLPRGKWRFLSEKEIVMLKRGIYS